MPNFNHVVNRFGASGIDFAVSGIKRGLSQPLTDTTISCYGLRSIAALGYYNEMTILDICDSFGHNLLVTITKRRNEMNRAELAAEVAEKTGLTKKDANNALSAALEAIQKELASGGKVQLIGFGSFEIKERPERTGRNTATKETITIPASKTPVFKAGKALKDAVNL